MRHWIAYPYSLLSMSLTYCVRIYVELTIYKIYQITYHNMAYCLLHKWALGKIRWDHLKMNIYVCVCDCQTMPQYNEYGIHNYDLMSYGVCVCRYNTECPSIPLNLSLLHWIAKEFYGTKMCKQRTQQRVHPHTHTHSCKQTNCK